MDDVSTKRRIGGIVVRMRAVLRGNIDDKAIGELQGLANELAALEGDISDSKLRNAIKSAVNLVAGGLTGYGIGQLADYLASIEVLL